MLRDTKELKNFAIAADERARWSTSSFGSPPDRSALELAALGEHMNRCAGQRGALFAWRCAAEALNDFAAPRLMTMLTLFALLSLIASFVI